MATETEKWFVEDLLKWRQFGGSAWSVMLATALTAFHVAGGFNYQSRLLSRHFFVQDKLGS